MPSPYPPHQWKCSEQELVAALFSNEPRAAAWREEHSVEAAGQLHLLDYRYNAITGLRHKQHPHWNVDDAKVLHYTCGPKPWRPIATDTLWNRVWAQWYRRAFPDSPPPPQAGWMHELDEYRA